MPRYNISTLITTSVKLLFIFGVVRAANKEYWWMDDQSLFAPSNSVGNGGGNHQGQGSNGGCGGNGGSCGGNNGGNYQSQPSNNNFNSGQNQHSSNVGSQSWKKPQSSGWNNNNQGSSSNHRPAVDPQPLRTPAPKRRPAPKRNKGCGGGGYGGGSNCGNSLPAPSRPANGAPVVSTECPSGSKCVADHFCDANGVMSNSRVSLSQWEKEQRGTMISCMMNQSTGSWGICCGIPANRQPSRPANNNYGNGNNNQGRQPSRPANNNVNNQNRAPARPNNNNQNNKPPSQPKPAILTHLNEVPRRTFVTHPAVPLSVLPFQNNG